MKQSNMISRQHIIIISLCVLVFTCFLPYFYWSAKKRYLCRVTAIKYIEILHSKNYDQLASIMCPESLLALQSRNQWEELIVCQRLISEEERLGDKSFKVTVNKVNAYPGGARELIDYYEWTGLPVPMYDVKIIFDNGYNKLTLGRSMIIRNGIAYIVFPFLTQTTLDADKKLRSKNSLVNRNTVTPDSISFPAPKAEEMTEK